MNYGKILRARKRIEAHMRDNSILPPDKSKRHWPRELSAVIFSSTGEKRALGESHTQYQVRMAIQLPLKGRDVLRATPTWANKHLIEEKYRECAEMSYSTGIPHHVDHIIPIQGRKVCGLHTHENLRVIPATDNLKKSNRFHG